MEALKTYYFAYDTLQKDRELFKGKENITHMCYIVKINLIKNNAAETALFSKF